MRIFPLGENAVTVEFGDAISPELNTSAISLATDIESDPFPGFVESVPAYASTTVFFDAVAVKKSFPGSSTASEKVREIVEDRISRFKSGATVSTKTVEIPVNFRQGNGLDLPEMSLALGKSDEEIVAIFIARTYRVYMLGFLPGFAYMGEVDDLIAMPRRGSPRSKVPKGSVGIAGKQTGIYPLESPGGWQIIGRTEIEMFDPAREPSCLLSPGDDVRFVPI